MAGGSPIEALETESQADSGRSMPDSMADIDAALPITHGDHTDQSQLAIIQMRGRGALGKQPWQQVLAKRSELQPVDLDPFKHFE